MEMSSPHVKWRANLSRARNDLRLSLCLGHAGEHKRNFKRIPSEKSEKQVHEV
jgi:hypothetical protein